jgi:hypothetical protein
MSHLSTINSAPYHHGVSEGVTGYVLDGQSACNKRELSRVFTSTLPTAGPDGYGFFSSRTRSVKAMSTGPAVHSRIRAQSTSDPFKNHFRLRLLWNDSCLPSSGRGSKLRVRLYASYFMRLLYIMYLYVLILIILALLQ